MKIPENENTLAFLPRPCPNGNQRSNLQLIQLGLSGDHSRMYDMSAKESWDFVMALCTQV